MMAICTASVSERTVVQAGVRSLTLTVQNDSAINQPSRNRL